MINPFVPEHYINPLSDFGFKRLFGTESNKDLLVDFLNALVGRTGEDRIRDVTFLNPEQLGSRPERRRAVFDIYCRTEGGEYVIVEMQNAPVPFFKDRSVFYSAFPIRDQAVKGEEWDFSLQAVYAVGLLNFCFLDGRGDGDYIHRIKLMDTMSGTVFYDKLTFIFAELPKFVKREGELATDLDRWLFAIKNLCGLDAPSPALTGRVFDKLFREAAVAGFTMAEQWAYFESQKQYLYYVNSLRFAEMKGMHIGEHLGHASGLKEGIELGKEQGIELGRKEGIELGKEQGIELGRKEGAERERRMLREAMEKMGFSDEIIAGLFPAL